MMDLRECIHILKKAEKFEDIDKHREEILELMPKLGIMVGFDQQNPAHQYDLWEHCCRTVTGLLDDIDDDMLYLAALIHDIGKPDMQTAEDKNGHIIMHYYGHPGRSMEITRDEIIPGLLARKEALSEDDQRRLLYYVAYHDDRMSLRMKHLRQHLRMGASLGEFKNLMKLQIADARAHVQIPVIMQRIEICEKLSGDYGQKLYDDILAGK